MIKNELSRLFIVIAITGAISISLSACKKSGGPTGGAGPAANQQQQSSERGMNKQSTMGTKKQSYKSTEKRTQEQKSPMGNTMK